MKCADCGQSVFFLADVHRYAPSFDKPDMHMAECAFCGSRFLKYRQEGNWCFAPLESVAAKQAIHNEAVRKVGP